ncbi:hypothetical protein F5Y12DRAFT_709548 [Xylaria sp. FL1777]|nr:hypothetical protein F5Y12DRAFT_709548 [Xylaria sp. FL1777]
MERPLICTSLRKRLDWVGLPASLLQRNKTQLDTHDVAVPLAAQRVFRAIFISPCDVASATCSARIERLYNLNAGQDSGIIFLLKHEDEQQSAMHALMTLQTKFIGRWEMPIIPVDSVAAVPASLVTIQSQLSSPAANRKPPSAASHLLPFCSDSVPLTEHTVNILTDTTCGFKDLLDKLSSDAVFESTIAPLLGCDADKLRNFWADDYFVD